MMNRTKKIIAQSPEKIAQAIGLTAADSKEWQVQYVLLKRLQQVVRVEGLTHAEVARRGRSSRTRVTAILNGNLDKVSSDLLIRLLGALGYRVKVSVSRVETVA
jgi:predicted XRE-type DNA-binding protein